MTFSLLARCADSGMFGVAISSSSPAVAARCSHAKAGIGAVATQNITDPTLGAKGLERLTKGASSREALESLKHDSKFMDYRQVLIVDKDGTSATHSGSNALGIWNAKSAQNVASGGNLLENEHIPDEMISAFLASSGHLGDRLLGALQAGLDAGGEAGPVHSAGLLVVDKVSWPIVDLRCDWTEDCPIKNVTTAWDIFKPQMQDYVNRALDPEAAPSFGVPGDE